MRLTLTRTSEKGEGHEGTRQTNTHAAELNNILAAGVDLTSKVPARPHTRHTYITPIKTYIKPIKTYIKPIKTYIKPIKIYKKYIEIY